jgi:hypothetical protein
MRQTAVEFLMDKLLINDCISVPKDYWYEYLKVIEQAKEMERGQVQLYVIFCLRCMKENLPIIKFEDFIKLEGGEK